MAVQLGLSAAGDQGLHVRLGGERRSGHDRRGHSRRGPDRRRSRRRRATLRSVLFTTLTLGFPHSANLAVIVLPLKPASFHPVPHGSVTVSPETFVVIPPWRAYNDLIAEAARRYGVAAALIRSVMQTESAFNPIAVSRAGAMGLMQLMPEVAAEFGVEDPFDPRENIMAGARYLRRLLDLHGGDVRLTLASYNAGPGVVARYGGEVPPYEETQDYVERVTGLMARAR